MSRTEDKMKKKPEIFIISTFIDLKKEREAVSEAIVRSDFNLISLENEGPSSERAQDLINRFLDQADAIVLLLGERYGSIAPEESVSWTEFEFDRALAQGKTILAYVKKGADKLSPEISRFRHRLGTDRFFKEWENIEDLQLSVIDGLSVLRQRLDNPENPSISSESLRLVIDPGTAPPDAIADILSDISMIYRATGGSGITFQLENAGFLQETGAAK